MYTILEIILLSGPAIALLIVISSGIDELIYGL